MNAQMLEAFYHEQVQRVVYIGSITLYQDFEGHIKEEELDLNQDPHPAYLGVGWVHRYTEKLCKFWHEQCGMNIVIVRAANVFGPYAKFDPHTSNFIPAIIRKAVDKMDPFEVWGTPDVTRDVIYSEDFAHAIIGMLDDDQIKFDTFNVGSSMETTVGDVLTWALRYAKHEPNQIKYMADRPTTNKFKALDCSKVKQVLGWQPYYTVEQGIQKTTEWWINNKNWWKK
jgi:GDP-L-fucose synthase